MTRSRLGVNGPFELKIGCHSSLIIWHSSLAKRLTIRGALQRIVSMRTSAFFTIPFAMAAFASSSLAQDQAASPASSPTVATSPVAAPGGEPKESEMMNQMTELSKLNENHKLLTSLDGTWNYTIKFWMNPDPNAKPQESKGTAV